LQAISLFSFVTKKSTLLYAAAAVIVLEEAALANELIPNGAERVKVFYPLSVSAYTLSLLASNTKIVLVLASTVIVLMRAEDGRVFRGISQ